MTEPEWRAGVDRKLTDIDKRLFALEKTDAVGNVNMRNLETRLDKIENTLVWLVRLIIGAILLAMIAFLVKGGFAP